MSSAMQYARVEDLRRNLGCLAAPAALVLFVAQFLSTVTAGAGPAALSAATLAGAVYAAVVGVPTLRPTQDPTLQVRVRTWPLWHRVAVSAAAVVAALIGLVAGAGKSTSGVGAFATLVAVPLVAVMIGPWVWRQVTDRRSVARTATAPAPPADAAEREALARVSPQILHMAGLAVRSPQTGLDILPELAGHGLDERGRPYMDVRVIAGRQTVATVAKRAGELASAWGVPRVEVTEPTPHVARVTGVLRESTLSGPVTWEPVASTGTATPVAEYVAALPMGAHVATGDPWTLDLREQNYVIAGLPGSGKSSFANALLAHLAQHPHVRIAFIDPKFGAEAAPWAPRLDEVIAGDPELESEENTAQVLEFVEAANRDVGRRYRRMVSAGVTNAWKEDFLGEAEPLKVLVIDECAELFKTDTPERSRMAERMKTALKSYVQMGRAAGYVLIMATQFPKEESLPNSIREVVSASIAFRMKSDRGTYSVLGSGYVPEHPMTDPTTITQSTRGQAVLVSDEGDQLRLQMAYLEKAEQRMIVEQTAGLRRAWLDEAPAAPAPEPAHDAGVVDAEVVDTPGDTPDPAPVPVDGPPRFDAAAALSPQAPAPEEVEEAPQPRAPRWEL